jgi:hypothetical protein
MITVGQRVQTKKGTGTCTAVTAYQVQVQPDDGDDAYWTTHGGVSPAPIEDEQHQPTVAELLDACAQLLELARAGLAALPPAPLPDPSDATPRTSSP